MGKERREKEVTHNKKEKMGEETVAATYENLIKEAEKMDLNEEESSTTETESTTTSGGNDDGEPKSMKKMIEAMNEHSDGTNVIKESLTTFTSMDGVEQKGDIVIDAS